LLFIKYYFGAQIIENEMGEACSMYRVRKRNKRGLERPRRILEDNIKIGGGESDGRACNGLIWDRWRAVVNTVMNLRIPPNAVSVLAR
jgi:hypothetical protein